MPLHRGRIATHPKILDVRPLTREDLGVLTEGKRTNQGAVSRFRDPHHRIARLFASGLRGKEVAERSGYSYNRVHLLSADPAFQELIAKYRTQVDAAFVRQADDYYELATANMIKAEAQIAEKLEAAEEAGDLLPTRDLIAISRDAADRFGYGKRQTNLNINADFAAQLEAAINRSGKSIEMEASSPAVLLSQSPQESAHSPPAPGESQQPAANFRRRA